MAEILCHHEGRYNFYLTVADGFRFVSSLDYEQMVQFTQGKYGETGMRGLPERLERAHKNGHSAWCGGTLEDFLCCNRAGDDEAHLSFDECVSRFLS